jgi:hypothetical protein
MAREALYIWVLKTELEAKPSMVVGFRSCRQPFMAFCFTDDRGLIKRLSSIF